MLIFSPNKVKVCLYRQKVMVNRMSVFSRSL
jgi:hypothetical protein